MISKIWANIKSLTRTNFLFFNLGILSGLLIYFYSEANYEKELFEALAQSIRSESSEIQEIAQKDSVEVLRSVTTVHNLIANRNDYFGNIQGVKARLIQPLTVDLMTGKGECGSYALTLARLLLELRKEVRIVQMKVAGKYGGHILVETKLNNRWIVVDPMYNLHFMRADHTLASFSDVHHNWTYYKLQVPEGYNLKYSYEGLRYTNWNKFPLIMPALKRVLDWTLGSEKANAISLRIYSLKKFDLLFNLTFGMLLLLILYSTFYTFKRRRHQFQNPKAINKRPQSRKVVIVSSNNHPTLAK